MGTEQQPRVLIVDDDYTTRTLVGGVLRTLDYDYEYAIDAHSGLEKVSKEKFDVVIVDLVLPDLGGHDLLKKLRAHDPNQAVMFMSSRYEPEQVLQILRDGAFDFLAKPLKLPILKASLRRAISLRKEEWQEQQTFHAIEQEESIYRFSMQELPESSFTPPIISRLLQAGMIDLNLKIKMTMAVQEALINAIEHGNLELESSWKEEWNDDGEDKFSSTKSQRLKDPKFSRRTIKITTKYYPGILKISVEDEGKGFNAPRGPFCPIQSKGEQLLSGRGLAIMNGSFDSMSYNDQGNQVTLVKTLDKAKN